MKDLLRPRSWFLAMAAIGSLGLSADAQSYSAELYQNLRWENIGPARGGRSTATAGSDARPLEYYFGASGGGLWKTADAGTTYRSWCGCRQNTARPTRPSGPSATRPTEQ